MGSSHSDEGKSGLRSKTFSTAASKSTIKSTIKESKDRFNRLEKWRKVFQDIISSEKYQENKYWNKIVADLLHFTKRVPTERDMEWMKDPQFGSLASFTQYCRSSAEEGEIQMVGLDEQSVLETQPMQTSFKNNSLVDPTSICDQRTNLMKNSAMSVQFGQASNIFSSFQERPSIIPELRKVLLNQIEEPNHVIQGLVNTFKQTCEKLFANLVMTLDTKTHTNEHEDLLVSISGCCKKFICILVKFMGWIYKEPLEQFEHTLDQENLSITYLIEDVMYELLFKGPNSRLYTLVFHLLSIKYRCEQKKFKEILAQKKNDALSSYDEVFVASKDFLLEPSTAPYNEAINKIKGLRTMTNPYTKYDITMSIEDEMWSCICQHYKDDAQMLAELRHSFGMDFRLPIFTYCIIQSQSEDLVIHRRFIEEFIDSHILDHSFGFTVFKSSLDFLLQDRPSCRKLSDDMQILTIAMTSKRNSLK